MRKHVVPFLLAIAILSGCKKDLTEQNDSSISSSKQEDQIRSGNYVSNELLIKFKSGLSENEKLKALSVINGNVTEKIFTKAMQHFEEKEGVYLIHTPL